VCIILATIALVVSCLALAVLVGGHLADTTWSNTQLDMPVIPAWACIRRNVGLTWSTREAREYLESKNIRPLSGPLEQLIASPAEFYVKPQIHPLLGQAAPGFELRDSSREPWKLSDALARGPVVLVFYYGYHCIHCVGQLFVLHDDIERFRELGATVVAVSADPSETTLERFRQHGQFAFPVLSDPGNQVAQQYRVFRPARDGKPENLEHGTFVIG